MGYLTSATDFGALEWIFFIAQAALLVAGIYLALLRSDGNATRATVFRALGYILLGVGGIGLLFGIFHLANIRSFALPIWKTIVTVVEVAVAIYAAYVITRLLPARMAAAASRPRATLQRPGAARPAPAAARQTARPAPTVARPSGTPGVSADQPAVTPVPVSPRRDTRRARKRKSR